MFRSNVSFISTIFMIVFTAVGCAQSQNSLLTSTQPPSTEEGTLEATYEWDDANSSLQESILLPTLSLETSISGEEPPLFFKLEDVECSYFNSPDSFTSEYWIDALIPGKSTLDDLLEIKKLPNFITPQYEGVWDFVTDLGTLVFTDGLLTYREDPRHELNEIVGYYGIPEEIIWKVPKRSYHNAHYVTYLIYSEQNTVFFTFEKLVAFKSDTKLQHSFVATDNSYENFVSNLREDNFDKYEKFVLPC